MDHHTNSYIHKPYLEALLSGDIEKCSEVVKNYLANGMDIKALYEEVIKKALYEVGLLWEYNKITHHTEHLATTITETILNDLYEMIISKERINKNVVLACVEGELHQVGIKMVADIFEMKGWNAHILPPYTSTDQIISKIESVRPDVVGLSVSIYFNFPSLEKMIQRIQTQFPGMPIIVGGQAFRLGGKEVIKKYNNVIYLPDLHSVELYVN